MLSNDEAIAKFKEIIGTKEGWQYLKDSQFVSHLSVFMSWALRASQYGAERAMQENFLSTALNQSSIMAHAEDRGYIPRKALPSTGIVTIKNTGKVAVSVPVGQTFTSNYGIDYRIAIPPDTIAPGATAYADISQLSQQIILHDVTVVKPYYEILFDAALTSSISQIDVSVDLHDGAGYLSWEIARLFQNTLPTSTAYDEFFTHNGQIGVRFGNGDYGSIIPLGASVKIVLWLTAGATILQAGTSIAPSGASILDITGAPASLTFIIGVMVIGGEPIETSDELRKNLFYWPLYQEQLVWQEDYEFFLKREFPEILWINVWGETEAESESGYKNLEFVNKIFVSAYAQDNIGIGTDIIAKLQSVRLLNRRFQWVFPVVHYFTVSIVGAVSSKYATSIVRQKIITALEANYGLNSRLRKPDVLLKEIYALVEATGCFADGDYTAALAGNHEITALNQIIAIDLNASIIDLTRW